MEYTIEKNSHEGHSFL